MAPNKLIFLTFITLIPNYASVLARYYTYQTNQCTHFAKLCNTYRENSLSKYSKCHTCHYMLITNLILCIILLRVSAPSSNFEPVIFPLQAPFFTMGESLCSSQTSSHSFSHKAANRNAWFLGLQMHTYRGLFIPRGLVMGNGARMEAP